MLRLLKTNSSNPDFIQLVAVLDKYLAVIDGDEHAVYAQWNKTDSLQEVIVAYMDDTPVGCGALRKYDEHCSEVKRMFVHEAYRGQGIARQILKALEEWAAALHFDYCILETGKRQAEAIALYLACGYGVMENYGKYKDMENSVCMRKAL